jgi:hypothetical protein
MPEKLTLYIDDDLIFYVKKYAKEQQLSVSKVINNFLTILKEEIPEKKVFKKQTSAPVTQSLKGIASHLDLDISDYHNYLEEKYL